MTAVWVALPAVAFAAVLAVGLNWHEVTGRTLDPPGPAPALLAQAETSLPGGRGRAGPGADPQEADTIIIPWVAAPALPAYVMRELWPYRSVQEWYDAKRADCGVAAIEAA